jgi:ATP-dependent DNA helicase RecQ
VDHERYNVLRLEPASREVLRGERQLRLRRHVVAKNAGRRSRRAAGADAIATSHADSTVYAALKAWRLETARAAGLPAYAVFHDATLQALAAARPTSLHALREIPGIGAAKLERYGEALLGVLASVESAA